MICSEFENCHFSTIKNPSAIFKKIPLTFLRFYHKMSRYALILYLSFSEFEIYHFPATLYIAYIWRPFWILRGSVTLKSHKTHFLDLFSWCLPSCSIWNVYIHYYLFFIFEPPIPGLNINRFFVHEQKDRGCDREDYEIPCSTSEEILPFFILLLLLLLLWKRNMD